MIRHPKKYIVITLTDILVALVIATAVVIAIL